MSDTTRNKRARLVAALSVAGLLIIASLALADVPHTFTNGTVADADEVNANFAALDASQISKGNIYEVTASTSSCNAGFNCFATAVCDDVTDVAISGSCARGCNALDAACHLNNPFFSMGISFNDSLINAARQSCAILNTAAPVPTSLFSRVNCLSLP